LFKDSPIHRHLFWVAISVLQLDEVSLYAAGLALIEQNLHMLDSMGMFENQVSMCCICRLTLLEYLSSIDGSITWNMTIAVDMKALLICWEYTTFNMVQHCQLYIKRQCCTMKRIYFLKTLCFSFCNIISSFTLYFTTCMSRITAFQLFFLPDVIKRFQKIKI